MAAPLMRVRAGNGLPIAERTPPLELQLWNVGDNPTDYGVHRWTERSVREVLAQYNERGNPLLIDVEHLGPIDAQGGPAVTGGYAHLEIRDGAPWLRFEWSDFGAAQIISGQRRFLSPEYAVDKTSGEIVELSRVSLVAAPGTHRARVLASALNPTEQPMDLAMILAALTAALAAEDPAVAKESALNLVAELKKSTGGDAGADPAAETAGEGPGAPPPGADDQTAGMRAAADEDKKDDKEKVSTSAPKPAPKPAAPPAAAPPASSPPATEPIAAAAAAAVDQIQAAQRDHLLSTQGDRLEPSIRRWCASQPLATVKGLLEATPDRGAPAARPAPTRGAAQGSPAVTPEAAAERDQIRAAMGRMPAAAPQVIDTPTLLVLPLMKPSQVRERITASAAAGKDGK